MIAKPKPNWTLLLRNTTTLSALTSFLESTTLLSNCNCSFLIQRYKCTLLKAFLVNTVFEDGSGYQFVDAQFCRYPNEMEFHLKHVRSVIAKDKITKKSTEKQPYLYDPSWKQYNREILSPLPPVHKRPQVWACAQYFMNIYFCVF